MRRVQVVPLGTMHHAGVALDHGVHVEAMPFGIPSTCSTWRRKSGQRDAGALERLPAAGRPHPAALAEGESPVLFFSASPAPGKG